MLDFECASEVLALLPVIPEEVWMEYVTACMKRQKLDMALGRLRTLTETQITENALWNLTIEIVCKPGTLTSDIQKVLESIPGDKKIYLWRRTLSRAVRRLIKSNRIQPGFAAIKRFKGAVSTITLTKIFRLLLAKRETEVLGELLDLMGSGYFKHVVIWELELPGSALMELISLQQSRLEKVGGSEYAEMEKEKDMECQTEFEGRESD